MKDYMWLKIGLFILALTLVFGVAIYGIWNLVYLLENMVIEYLIRL